MKKIKFNKNISIYLIIIIIIGLLSFFSEILTGYSAYEISYKGLQSPNIENLLGTDFLGRDILTRTLKGAQLSIFIGILARTGSLFIGIFYGFLIANTKGIVKEGLNKVLEVFMAIPALLLAMALAVVLGKGTEVILVAIIVGTWAPVAKIISIRIEEINELDYVKSAYAMGGALVYIQRKHVFPALLPTLIPVATTGIATSIMMEATLSFLGLGGASSMDSIPTWGGMINIGTKFIFDAPWMILPPILFLMILTLAFNRIGDILSSK